MCLVENKYGKCTTTSTSCASTPCSTAATCTTSTTHTTIKLVTFLSQNFSGKPEEDEEAHLLRTNNWMNPQHQFQEGVKVQRFCLTLLEARLWFESLRPINID